MSGKEGTAGGAHFLDGVIGVTSTAVLLEMSLNHKDCEEIFRKVSTFDACDHGVCFGNHSLLAKLTVRQVCEASRRTPGLKLPRLRGVGTQKLVEHKHRRRTARRDFDSLGEDSNSIVKQRRQQRIRLQVCEVFARIKKELNITGGVRFGKGFSFDEGTGDSETMFGCERRHASGTSSASRRRSPEAVTLSLLRTSTQNLRTLSASLACKKQLRAWRTRAGLTSGKVRRKVLEGIILKNGHDIERLIKSRS